ncbi:MAG: MFS transporter [Clostridiales bacterium]|nr:MFS transporter [Clostridiales bacterium]MCF8022084.1 MFS transporter [Clostridiales bacterium]
MRLNTKFKVASLGTTNFIIVLVNTILFPVFPSMSKALDINIKELSWLVVIVSFPAALLGPVGGILSDKWNRKQVISISLIIYGLGGLFAGLSILLFSKPFYFILGGRLLQGIGSATPMFLTTALAGDIFHSAERHKAVGLLETANGTGKLFSPIIGALVGLLAWYAPFFVYPLVSVPAAAAVWFSINEPDRPPVPWTEQKKAFGLFRNRSRILALVSGFITLFVLIGTLFWLSNILEDKLNGGKIIRGLIISLPVMTMVLTTLAAEYFGKHLGARLTLGTGLILMASSLALIPLIYKTIIFWPVIGIIGVGAGMVLPTLDAISTSVTKREYRGIITTIYGSSRSLGASLAPYIFALLMDAGHRATFFPIAAGSAIAGIIILTFMHDNEILSKNLLPERTS